MTHGDIEDADIQKVSTYIKDMVGIGVLIPDDGLEDYIRQIGNLPERVESNDNARRTPEARQYQQEQNQPPEPQTAVGKEPSNKDDEIPNDVVEAAKRRLGRSE